MGGFREYILDDLCSAEYNHIILINIRRKHGADLDAERLIVGPHPFRKSLVLGVHRRNRPFSQGHQAFPAVGSESAAPKPPQSKEEESLQPRRPHPIKL